MLESKNVLWDADVPPYLSTSVAAHVASEPWQLSAYYRLRRAVFAEEQGLFAGSDVDEHDAHATPIVAMGHLAGMPDEIIGVVRIYRSGGGVWYGGRLGVSPAYRSRGVVGTSLICAAVSTAHALGCRRFLATIQVQNVRYFEHHRFFTVDHVNVCGQPHHLMEASLDAYPPVLALAESPVRGEVAAVAFRRPRAA